jgi:molybdopterin synthase sulfur carrier subunit
MARVKLYGNLRRLSATPHCVVQGATVREILDALARDNARLRAALFHDDALAEHIRITRNGRDIRHAQNLETPLSENDELAIFPPVAGG